MSQAPKVSVIVPCYNNEQYLPQCLDSALKQSMPDFEVICVNDGSKDSSLDIMKKYQAKDTRIRIIDKPNTGYGHSMNCGLDEAKGEYIAILESDDSIEQSMFEDLYALAQKHDLDFIKADFTNFSGEGFSRKSEYKISCEADPTMYNKVLNPQVDFEVFDANLVTWTGIYRRSFIEKHHIRYHETPGAAYQDNGFWLQTFAFAKKIMFVPRAYYQYRQDNPNSSINSTEKVYCMHEEHLFMHEFLDKHPEFPKRFYRIWAKKMYHNYNFTYQKIADIFKGEFLECCQKDFKQAFLRGEFNINDLHEEEWAIINDLVDDPHLSHLKFENILSNSTDSFVEQYQRRKMQSIINDLIGQIKVYEKSRLYSAARKIKNVNDYRRSFGFAQLIKRALFKKSAIGLTPRYLSQNAIAHFSQWYSPSVDPFLAYANSFMSLDTAEALESWYRRKTGNLLNLNATNDFEAQAQRLKLSQAQENAQLIGSTLRVYDYAKSKITESFFPKNLVVCNNMKEAENYLFEHRPSSFRLFTNAKIPWDIQVFDSSVFEIEEAYRHFEPLTRSNLSFLAGEQIADKSEALKIIIELSPTRPQQSQKIRICCIGGKIIAILKESYDNYPKVDRVLYDAAGHPLASGENLVLPEEILEATKKLSADFSICAIVFEITPENSLLRSIDLGMQGGLFSTIRLNDDNYAPTISKKLLGVPSMQ